MDWIWKDHGAIYSGRQEYIAGVEKFQVQRHKAVKPGIAGKKKNVEVWAFFIIDTCVWEIQGELKWRSKESCKICFSKFKKCENPKRTREQMKRLCMKLSDLHSGEGGDIHKL
jgi:hypothetical protein